MLNLFGLDDLNTISRLQCRKIFGPKSNKNAHEMPFLVQAVAEFCVTLVSPTTATSACIKAIKTFDGRAMLAHPSIQAANSGATDGAGEQT